MLLRESRSGEDLLVTELVHRVWQTGHLGHHQALSSEHGTLSPAPAPRPSWFLFTNERPRVKTPRPSPGPALCRDFSGKLQFAFHSEIRHGETWAFRRQAVGNVGPPESLAPRPAWA